MTYIVGAIVTLAALIGLVLTLFTFSGAWVTVAAAAGVWIWQPDLYSWPTFLIAVAFAALGDLIEVVSSAMGVKRQGGGRAASTLSVVGAIAGAILGSIFIPVPIVGTIAGAVLGAGLGAVAGERGVTGSAWGQSARVGAGAGVARLIATFAKIVFTGASSGLLIAAAFV